MTRRETLALAVSILWGSAAQVQYEAQLAEAKKKPVAATTGQDI